VTHTGEAATEVGRRRGAATEVGRLAPFRMGNAYSRDVLYPQGYLYPPAPPPQPPFPPPQHGQLMAGQQVPQLLWVYWDAGEEDTYSELVAASFAAMRKVNPGWKLRILGPDAAEQWGLAPPPHPLSGPPLGNAALGDWFRLGALAMYGGVYLDATMIQFRTLEHWVDRRSDAVQGFQMPEGQVQLDEPATMDSFAIAAQPNSTFIRRWHAHLGEAFRAGTLAWSQQQRPDQVGSLCNQKGSQPDECYWIAGLAWRVTRDELDSDVFPTTLRSSTAIGRPFHYLVQQGENSRSAVTMVLTAQDVPYTDMIKLRKSERNCVRPLTSYYLADEPFEEDGTPTNIAAWLRTTLEAQHDLLQKVNATIDTSEGTCEEPSTAAALIVAIVSIAIVTPILVCCIVLLEKRRKQFLRGATMTEDTELLAKR